MVSNRYRPATSRRLDSSTGRCPEFPGAGTSSSPAGWSGVGGCRAPVIRGFSQVCGSGARVGPPPRAGIDGRRTVFVTVLETASPDEPGSADGSHNPRSCELEVGEACPVQYPGFRNLRQSVGVVRHLVEPGDSDPTVPSGSEQGGWQGAGDSACRGPGATART